MGGDRQIGRRLDHTQQAGQKAEMDGEQPGKVAQTQQLRLQQGRRPAIERERTDTELAVGHQPDDVEVDRSAGAGRQRPGQRHGTDHPLALLRYGPDSLGKHRLVALAEKREEPVEAHVLGRRGREQHLKALLHAARLGRSSHRDGRR